MRSSKERERKELQIHIYEGKRGKREQTLVIDVNSDQHSNVYLGVMRPSVCLQEKKSTERRHPDGMSFFEHREKIGEEEIRKRVANLSLLLSSFQFSRVHLEPIQEAATENFA